MKRILCYGDSNTHGTMPMNSQMDIRRHPFDVRWPGVVQKSFGTKALIIEEGLPGRTTVHDDPIDGSFLNGRFYLQACIHSHAPLDAVIIMLGVNDLKLRFNVSAWDIADSIGKLADLIRSSPVLSLSPPKILLVASPPILETSWLTEVFRGGADKSQNVAAHLKNVAAVRNLDWLDLKPVAKVSPVDGIHFDALNQIAIGNAIYEKIRKIFEG